MAANLAEVGAMRYVSLGTFRKSGTEVRTPVWIAEADGALYVYSENDAGKVKRIRANGRAQLAECNMSGKLLGDPPSQFQALSARMVEDSATREKGLAALAKKYGWQMKLATLLSRLGRRYHKRAVIELTLEQ